jgi:hypothetical protein
LRRAFNGASYLVRNFIAHLAGLGLCRNSSHRHDQDWKDAQRQSFHNVKDEALLTIFKMQRAEA